MDLFIIQMNEFFFWMNSYIEYDVWEKKKEDVIIYVENKNKRWKWKTKYDFNIKNGVCMCVNQINQSIVGHNNIYYEHDDDGMVWYMA